MHKKDALLYCWHSLARRWRHSSFTSSMSGLWKTDASTSHRMTSWRTARSSSALQRVVKRHGACQPTCRLTMAHANCCRWKYQSWRHWNWRKGGTIYVSGQPFYHICFQFLICQFSRTAVALNYSVAGSANALNCNSWTFLQDLPHLPPKWVNLYKQ